MKRPVSLKWFLILAFLSLGVVLVIGYSVLTAQYFKRGMDNIVTANMESAANRFVAASSVSDQVNRNDFDGYVISSRWESLPAEIRNGFGTPPARQGVLYKHDDSGLFQRPDAIHFLMRLPVDGDELLIAHTVTRANASRLVGRNIARSMRTLFAISIASALALGIVIWLILRRVARPVAALGAWARSLDADSLDRPPPDFAYPELNQLADLMRGSLSSVQATLEREHRFLRHASHELRTPISVIRNNVELIERLETQGGEAAATTRRQAHDRIDRASLTMQHLTETLLWLSRDDTDPLPTQAVSLDRLLGELVDEMRYLLSDKHVEVDLQSEPVQVELPQVAARIVLGNLIRNAFQHSWDGRIRIHQRGTRVWIENPQPETAGPGETQASGFGLGLQLTAQLAERLGWPYRNEVFQGTRTATVTLGNS